MKGMNLRPEKRDYKRNGRIYMKEELWGEMKNA